MGKQLGFTGADSTGKTTLIKEICQRLENIGCIETLEVGNLARSSPYPLVEQQNIQSSNWILEQVKISESQLQKKADILICDRTVLDIWIFSNLAAYSRYISAKEINLLESKIRQALRKYHVIFYSIIDYKIPVRLENLPSSNLKVREKFEEILLASLEIFRDETFFVKLPSSYESRLDVVVSTLKSLKIL